MAPVTTALSCSSARRCHSSPLSVDDEDVDLAVADGLFALGQVGVAVDACRRADGVGLGLRSPREQSVGRGARRGRCPWCCRWSRSALGSAIAADDGDDHDHERREEGARAAAFAQLAFGDEPALPDAVHAATAWRNSSESVGGW